MSRRQHLPTPPKSREDTHAAIVMIDTMTSRSLELLYFLQKLTSHDVKELFIDGTFKCFARHIYQLYTIHGGKKGNYVPLLFALLPCKSEMCYQKMWKFITDYCTERNVVLSPRIMHIDFEKAMHNAV